MSPTRSYQQVPHEPTQHDRSSRYMFVFRQSATAAAVSRPSPRQILSATMPKRWRNLRQVCKRVGPQCATPRKKGRLRADREAAAVVRGGGGT